MLVVGVLEDAVVDIGVVEADPESDVVAGKVSEDGGMFVDSAVGAGAATGVGPGAGQFSFASSSVSTQPSST